MRVVPSADTQDVTHPPPPRTWNVHRKHIPGCTQRAHCGAHRKMPGWRYLLLPWCMDGLWMDHSSLPVRPASTAPLPACDPSAATPPLQRLRCW